MIPSRIASPFTYSAHAISRRKLPLFLPLGLLVFVFLAGRSVSNSITNFASGGFLFLFLLLSPSFLQYYIFRNNKRTKKTKFKKIAIWTKEFKNQNFTLIYIYIISKVSHSICIKIIIRSVCINVIENILYNLYRYIDNQ